MGKKMIYLGLGIFVLVVFFIVGFYLVGLGDKIVPVSDPSSAQTYISTSNILEGDNLPVNWKVYNYDFVDEHVKTVLTGMLGAQGKTAFYLPQTGYINVSRGSKFGVAYALNNPNPSGENYFEYHWTVDNSVVESCRVSVEVAQSWIERGWMSWGKIPQGWVDHMTVYFSFPADIEPCNVKYNFLITKDGAKYDSKVLEFNLI
ncbi:MAG: hypothetical protein ABIH79_02205 [archaeon]